MLARLLLALTFVALATCQTTEESMMMTTAEPPITEFSLQVHHLESSTNSIKFMWDTKVPKWMTVKSFQITTVKKDAEDILYSPELDAKEDAYEVENLVKDTEFKVCVQSVVLNNTKEEVEFQECFESYTIPYVRPDSVYVLFIVIGYILLMVLIGYVSWRCAVKKQEKEAAEAEEKEEENEGKKHANKPEEQKPILLSSPSDDGRPRSSIMDQLDDIPYITPPWTEQEKKEWEKQRSAKANSHA